MGFRSVGFGRHFALVAPCNVIQDGARKEETSRADNARFGVVIFSAPVGENGAYRTYWLLRDRNFSQAFSSKPVFGISPDRLRRFKRNLRHSLE